MPKCEKCGKEAKKLESDPNENRKICLKCMSESPAFPLSDEELELEDDRRAHVRIPMAIGLQFQLEKGTGSTLIYPATSVNISISGICFGWKFCDPCTGYIKGGVHSDCLFYPFSTSSNGNSSLRLKLQITNTYSLDIKAQVVYTLREEELGFEYVGAEFEELAARDKYIIEQILVKHTRPA